MYIYIHMYVYTIIIICIIIIIIIIRCVCVCVNVICSRGGGRPDSTPRESGAGVDSEKGEVSGASRVRSELRL